MKKKNVIILVVVLLLVILFGVGQFFAPANIGVQNTTSTAPAAITQEQGPVTQVIAYVPPTPATSTPVEKGSCWTSSIAAPFRTDAWRCSVGNAINDPCFQIPGSANLLCGANPAVLKATSSFVLKLTQPLPAPGVIQGPIPGDWAWLVELADGTICSPFTGTLPITQGGVSAGYGCAPKTPGGEGLYIFNDFNTSSSQWTAEVGNIAAATSGLPSIVGEENVPVATVWQ